MTVLLGGMRVLGTNYNNVIVGVFTDFVGSITNDFFFEKIFISSANKPYPPPISTIL